MGKVLLGLSLVMLCSCGSGFNYSNGERQGFVRKFSERGIFCKTWEGELVQQIEGVMTAETMSFVVKDSLIINQIKDALRTQKKIIVTYSDRSMSSACYSDSSYLLTKVEVK